jgi:hypothetical protein
MGTQRVQMKGVLPWLVRCARPAGTKDFYPALAALIIPVQNIFLLTVQYFNLCVSWVCSRAGPHVSECASPGPTFFENHEMDIFIEGKNFNQYFPCMR